MKRTKIFKRAIILFLIFAIFFLMISVLERKNKEDTNSNFSNAVVSNKDIDASTIEETSSGKVISPETDFAIEDSFSKEEGFFTEDEPAAEDTLEVHFIDVGQGDSILLKCGNESMLIDAGNNDKGTTVQLYLKKQNINELKYLVGTHPDADHIGGLDVIITKYDVTSGEIWMPNVDNDTATYRDVLKAIEYKSYKKVMPSGTYTLGSAEIEVLGPLSISDDTNSNSIVLKVTHGENTFLFTGDATSEEEIEILNLKDVSADVLKIGHHGSKSSTSDAFLRAVNPTYAVISCGLDNDYGHPTSEVLEKLKNRNIEVYRTDESGSIVAVSDGKTITWNVLPSTTWKAGMIKNEDISLLDKKSVDLDKKSVSDEITYVLNNNSKKFHLPTCDSVDNISSKNRQDVTWDLQTVLDNGYEPCKRCNPDKN